MGDENVNDVDTANAVLLQIYHEINASYVNNNNVNGTWDVSPGFGLRIFDSQSELNTFVLKPNYVKNQICFAINWNAFDRDTDTYDFEMRYITHTQIPGTVNNQEVSNGKFVASYAYQYSGTGFEGLMSLATAVIARELYSTDMDFQLMYTSMPTGDFIDNGAVVFVLIFVFPLVLYFFAASAVQVMQLGDEAHEEKVQWILKRSGMREVVEIGKQLVLFACITLLMGTLCALLVRYTGLA